jgi:hypothetical protein
MTGKRKLEIRVSLLRIKKMGGNLVACAAWIRKGFVWTGSQPAATTLNR